MFRFSKTYLLLTVVLAYTTVSFSQSIAFFSPTDLQPNVSHKIQLAGKIGTHYFIYHNAPSQTPRFLLLNEAGKTVKTVAAGYIRPGITAQVKLLAQEKSMTLVIQELINNTHYVKIASVNDEGELLEKPFYIDSSDFNLYGGFAYYNVVSNPDNSRYLLYRIVRGFSNIQILFSGILIDRSGQKISNTFFYIPFNPEMDQTGNPGLSNEGKMILPVYDKATNYKLGTNLRLYYSAVDNNPPQLLDFYLKEKKPVELLIGWHLQKNQLVLGGLFYNFYSKNIEGSMAMFISPEKKRMDTVLYLPLQKEFKKSLKQKVYNVSLKEVINSMQARYLHVTPDGSVQILSDVFTNSTYRGKPATVADWSDYSSGQRNQASAPTASVPRTSGANTNQERDISNYFQNTTTPNSRPLYPDRSVNPSGNRNNNSSVSASTSRQNWERGFSRNQQQMLTSSHAAFMSSSELSNLLVNNKTMNYKSVLFTLDPGQRKSWKNWTQNLFIPASPFSNVIIVPSDSALGVLSYEVTTRNNPYLLLQRFVDEQNIVKTPVGSQKDPFIFFDRNCVLHQQSLLSLYIDPATNNIGLAVIKWQQKNTY